MSITYDVARTQRLSLVPLRSKRPFERDWRHTPAILEHQDPAAAWEHATRTGDAGIVVRMSGLLGFESDTLQRRNELLRFLQVGGVVPCYVEARRGTTAKLHVYAREPRVLESDEDVAYYFDEGGLTAKRTAQLRCCLGPGVPSGFPRLREDVTRERMTTPHTPSPACSNFIRAAVR